MGWLFSIRLLWIRIEWAYCMAIILICLNVFLTCDVGILSFVTSSFIEGMWVVARAPDANTKSGATFQPLAIIALMSGWYLVTFRSWVSAENRSLQYVNSINCIVIIGVGTYGGGKLYGWPKMHNMSGLSLALQWHLRVAHVHGNNHGGIVFSGGMSLYVPAFIRM